MTKSYKEILASIPVWEVAIDEVPELTLAEAKDHVYDTFFGENGSPSASISPAVIRGGGELAVTTVMQHVVDSAVGKGIGITGANKFFTGATPHTDRGYRYRLTAHRTYVGEAEGMFMEGIDIEPHLTREWDDIRDKLINDKKLQSTKQPKKIMRVASANNDVILFDHGTPHAFTNITSVRVSDGKWTST